MTKEDFQKKSPLGIFFHYFRPHKRLFILDMCCAFGIALIDLAYPYISRIAMYTWLPDHAYGTFFAVMGIVAVAFLGRSLLYYMVTYWGHTFGIRVEADIRRDAFYHIQEMDCRFFDKNHTGKLLSNLTNDLFEITELAHHGPEDVLISLVTIVGALTFMFFIEWRLALVLSAIIPVFIFVLLRSRKQQQDASRLVKERTGAINMALESALTGMRTEKAFANEALEKEKFDAVNEEFKLSKRIFHKALANFNSRMEFFFCSLSVAVMVIGGFLIMQDRLHYIDLLTFTLYISSFINPVRKLSNFAELFSGGTAGLSRFIALMRTEPELCDAEDAKDLQILHGDIALKDVCFTYDRKEVLHHVNLRISGGETVAVVGSSGGGKTTLCQLIPRFYDADSGCIVIDGQDVRSVTQHSLHRNIGIVQQDVFLFAASIMENIRYGRLDASDAEVIEAAKRAEIYEDIMQMPDGFASYAGERGVLLSGGQKQRIAIARIFLKNPPILILDEATSALDSVTESHIQHALDALAEGRTTLIIAHRLSTVRKAQRILVMDEGIIKESGTHDELMAQRGLYHKLYTTQMSVQHG